MTTESLGKPDQCWPPSKHRLHVETASTVSFNNNNKESNRLAIQIWLTCDCVVYCDVCDRPVAVLSEPPAVFYVGVVT